ncbi:MAG: hypothetical protein ACRDVP_01910 [Acidimicrobiales bacterium]
MSLLRPILPTRRRPTAEDPGAADAPDTRDENDKPAEVDDEQGLRRVSGERCAWTLVWLGVLVGAVELWGSWWSWPPITVLAPALVALALVGMLICWCTDTPRSLLHQGLAILGALAAVGAPQVATIHNRLYYLTDAAALDHVAARVLVAGRNPYAGTLGAAASLLKVPSDFWTYTVGGGHIANVSYPAGSFLAYSPAFALGFHHQVVDWMDLYAWLASGLLLFFLLPRRIRWVGALIVVTGFFTTIFAGGETDAIYIPLAMLALYRWDRFALGRSAGVVRWMGPIALGIACTIKQTPWFLVPLLLIGLFIESHRAGGRWLRVTTSYLLVVLGVFSVVNLPFIIWGADRWWHGISTPLTQPLVADGQGLVSLALHGLTGGADLGLMLWASAAAYLGVLVAFALFYDWLKGLLVVLVPIAFFFAPRSLTGYLVDLVPIAIIGLLSVHWPSKRPAPLKNPRKRRLGHALLTGIGAATAALSSFSLVGAPLALHVTSATIDTSQQGFLAVTLSVTNATNASLRPHFMVDVGGPHPSGFWLPKNGGDVVVAPHSSKTVTLVPPAPTYLPPYASHYVISAYSSPRFLSTTAQTWHNYLPPGTR